MLATAPQLHNRIAGQFAPAPIPVPATPEGKQAAWGEAVFAAALFYQSQLAHPDERVAERAARALFDLEKTRLRHGRDLAGATEPKATDDTVRARDDDRPKLPTKADVERLGTIAKLAMDCDAFDGLDDDDEDEFDLDSLPPPQTEEEAVEAFAATPLFAPIVAAARDELIRAGRDASEPKAVAHAKATLLANLKRSMGAAAGAPK